MDLTTTQILQAFGFTLGCFTIHTFRSHAETLTEVLTYLVVVLAIATAALEVDRLLIDPDSQSAISIDLSQAL